MTLVTGDRVLVRVLGARVEVVSARAGEGRHVGFVRHADRGGEYVLPTDALPLVAAGRVDRRLFDVAALIRMGYDDSRPDLPVIVGHQGSSARSAGERLRDAGGRVTRDLPVIGASAATVGKARAGAFWRAATESGLSGLWLDGKGKVSLDRSVPQIGAPAAWQAGHTGAGATVAVIDSGLDATHPDLADAVAGAKGFVDEEPGTDDRNGHGTHVAGIITGNGAASGGERVGVAPDAKLLVGKVADVYGDVSESQVIAAMEWAVDEGADVVNISIGFYDEEGTGPLESALNRLARDSGTLFVVSAGNDGPAPGSLGSPGTADEALTVGAVDRQEALADFSSRGPRIGDLAVKPDITAPGVDIASARAGSDGDPYVAMSGTSMAAPHVAGAAAILAGQHPGWDADEIKPALMGSATPRDGATVYAQGAGRVDLARATTQSVTAAPASLSKGLVRWPYASGAGTTDTITYRNHGSAPVTLDVATDVRGPDGQPAPAGMFTVEPAQITVPAGGTTSVRLVTDPSGPRPPGIYGGYVVAGDGRTSVRTPVAVTLEVESYDLSLSFLDRGGAHTSSYSVQVTDVDTGKSSEPYDASGTVGVRLPRGRYYVTATVTTPDGSGGDSTTLVAEPLVTVTADSTFVVDARQAVPVGLAVDRPTARPASAEFGFSRRVAGYDAETRYFAENFDGLFVRPSRTSAPADEFTVHMRGHLAEPDGTGGFTGSPYFYHLSWTDAAGGLPDTLVKRIRDADLATVRTEIAASAPDQVARKDNLVDVATPATLVERYTPGLEWRREVSLRPRGAGEYEYTALIRSAPATYRRGTTVERWNAAPFGPSFPDHPSLGGQGGWRSDDTIGYTLNLFTDQADRHVGWSATDTAQTALSRNGRQVGVGDGLSGSFDVPSAPDTYRLEASATRSTATLSTRVDAAWTFRSGHSAAPDAQPLPLLAIRFAPTLDQRNRAKAGCTFALPVHVQRQPGAPASGPRALRVDVSYDDGGHWQPAPLTGSGWSRTAVITHPAADGFVSLRATAVDRDGNTAELTLVRAYAIGS
ncbi:S8 family serine peptidase [Phytohabitans sp. LJ34]|uniref:S8 family serine peptidase n=1 Tax=Phytohabitans sp. LJ34 TaxID=3452217 RepID=UPI003F8B68E0